MGSDRSAGAAEAAARALGRGADARVADGLSSVGRAVAALSGPPSDVVLKCLEPRSGPREELDDLAGGAQFGPWPPSLVFVAAPHDGQVSLATVAARSASDVTKVSARVVGVETTSGAFDWFKPKAKRVAAPKVEEPRTKRCWAEVALAVDESGSDSASGSQTNRRLVVGFAVAATEDAARAEVEPLARAVGAWSRGEPVDADAAPRDTSAAASGGLAEDVALAWGREGEVIVLRDYANPGPSRYTAAYRTTSIVSLVVALALAGSLAIQAVAGAPAGALIGTGAVAAVLLVNAFAFFQIAAFAGRYASDSLALAWFADDRVVVGPWLSRYGAVDTRPSGRLGAAIPTAEVNGVACFERGGRHAVEMASEHGPLEIVRTSSAAVAEDVKRFTEALLESIAAPRKKPKRT